MNKPNTKKIIPAGNTTAVHVNPIQLRFESELKELDGRDEDFPQQVTALADQYRERMKRYETLRGLLITFDRQNSIDGPLLTKLIGTCAQHVADIPAERLDP